MQQQLRDYQHDNEQKFLRSCNSEGEVLEQVQKQVETGITEVTSC